MPVVALATGMNTSFFDKGTGNTQLATWNDLQQLDSRNGIVQVIVKLGSRFYFSVLALTYLTIEIADEFQNVTKVLVSQHQNNFIINALQSLL